MSIRILYYKAYEENINSGLIEQLITRLPKVKKQKILRLRDQSAQFLSAAGLALLERAVSEFTDIDFDPEKLTFPENEKPQYPAKLDFNISHSGEMVCCVISETNKVGIDIEIKRQVTPTLMEKILGNQHSSQAFFDIWTRNEAIIKAACHGTVFNMKDISLSDDGGSYQGKFWYCYEITTEPNYTCHLATDAANADIHVHEIKEL